jgi:ABC-type transporter Mla subunit MlaD
VNITRLKESLVCLLLLVLTIGGANAFWNLRLLLREAKESAINIRSTTASIDEYVGFQTAQLQSPAYQKYMRGNFAVGSLLQSVVEGVNKTTLPKLNKNLDSSNDFILALNANTQTLNQLMANLDGRINGESGLLVSATALLQSLTATSDRFGLTVTTLDAALKVIAEKAGMTLDEVYKLAASPEWQDALKNVDEVTRNAASVSRHVDASAAQIEKSMESMPDIAKALQKIATTSAKYQKALLIVGILSTLGKAFLF